MKNTFVRLSAVSLICGCLSVLLAACPCRAAEALSIGWAERDVTPTLNAGKKIPLIGQYYVREATNIHSRLMFTCCVMRQGAEQALMASVDVVSGWGPFTERVAKRLHERIPEIRPECVFIGCPHTHSAPAIRPCWTPAADAWAKENPGYLTPNEYAEFVLEKAVDAFAEAWRNAKPGTVARAFGNARLGHCRIALYKDGTSEMYGDTHRADFVGMLEGEDSGVEMLFTCDVSGRKTGVFVNAACPAQILELTHDVSSDLGGATREKLARAYGENFRTIYHLGAGGCQSPRDLVRREREGGNGWDVATVDALSDRLVRCVRESAGQAKTCASVLKHRVEKLRLPRRRVTPEEVAAAKADLAQLEAKWPGTSAWDDFMRETLHYERTGGRLPFDSKLHPYAVMDVDRAVIERAQTQDRQPWYDIESHVVRIGDVAFVSHPFELYLLFGQTIKARSAAQQTFLIGKCDNGGYVPTEKSEKAVGYSGGVNVGDIGHVGGFAFCDGVVRGIAELFGSGEAGR